MTPLQTVTLTLLYLLPVALLALMLSGDSRQRPRWLLVTVLLALPVFYIGHYLTLRELQGWPATTDLPPEFRLLAFDVREPDPKTGQPGQILLWLRANGDEQPRVYRQPYRKQLHQELVDAGQRQAEGRPQIGRTAQREARRSGETGAAQVVRFQDAETRRLPAKH